MILQEMHDRELVNSFRAGNAQAIEVLINRHKSKVYTYILFVVKNECLAEDIFQDTFIKVISSLKQGKYNEQGVFVSWVVRIAHNLVIDYFRKNKKMPTISNDVSDELDMFNNVKYADMTIEDELIQGQISDKIRQLVYQLPEEQREVVLLRHFGDLSFKEIADQTGVSINTALGRMRYALINLRKLIEEKNLSLTVM
jgi:RNA polymerase sigma-70 factor (ECF subfamily)